MRLLLDTHVLLWWDAGKRLSRDADRAIRDADLVYVSTISGWEIALKMSVGRIKPRRTAREAIADSGFAELPVRLSHAEALADLPWIHRDPFDRMLAAQARAEGLSMVSRDTVFEEYGVRLIRT